MEWAANNGKAVRQRTVRQEITIFKAGTLHLNMYATSGQPTEKITMTTMELLQFAWKNKTPKNWNKNKSITRSLQVKCQQL